MFRFFFRIYFLIMAFFLFFYGMGVFFVMLFLRKEKKEIFLRKCTPFFCKNSFEFFGIKPEVTGSENIPENGSFLMVANHESFLDAQLVLGYVDSNMYMIVKQELESIPFASLVAKNFGIPLNRDNPNQAVGALKKAITYLRDGKRIAIFAEGTRHNDGIIHEFKKNSLKIASIAKVPVLPVVFHGTGSLIPKGKYFMNRGKVYVHILKPENTADYKDEAELSESVRQKMQHEMDKIIGDKS